MITNLLSYLRAGLVASLLIPLVLANAASGQRFPLQISENARYLIDQGGGPFLIFGDAAWSLFTGLTDSEAAEYLSLRKHQGFNTILVNVLDDSYRTLKDGTRPFADTRAIRQPEEKYFNHIEHVLSSAFNEGFLVMLAPVYLGCCDAGWKSEVGASTEEEMRDFGRYLGLRFRRFPNIWWVMGGDRDPDTGFDGHPRGLRRQVDALAEGIKEVWPDSFITAHTAHNNSARQQYGESFWLGINNIYTYYPEENKDPHVYVWAYREYDRPPAMPFFVIESAYERDGRTEQTRLTIRRQFYWAMLAGAAGHIYGHGLTWGAKPGWRHGLHAPGAQDLTAAKLFFDQLPWYRLRPDLDGRLITRGQSKFEDAHWMTAALTDDRSLAVIYVPGAMMPLLKRERLRALIYGEFAAAWSGFRKRKVQIDLSQLRSEPTAEWFFPATGRTEQINKGRPLSGRRSWEFDIPCHTNSKECDAVLVLKGNR